MKMGNWFAEGHMRLIEKAPLSELTSSNCIHAARRRGSYRYDRVLSSSAKKAIQKAIQKDDYSVEMAGKMPERSLWFKFWGWIEKKAW